MNPRFTVTYHVQADGSAAAEARARAIAVEQSVEMPVEGINDATVLADIVGQVQQIEPLPSGKFAVRIGLAVATILDAAGSGDFGQLLNMLFGNTSLHPDVVLHDVDLPETLGFDGPRHGIAGLRRLAGAPYRALTCSALKPQGLPPERLAQLAERFALGGVDFIKDDHGLADQAYSPFARRAPACVEAVRRANAATGGRTQYAPSLSGNLDQLRAQLALARNAGIAAVIVSPMIAGPSNIQVLIAENPDIAFIAHPTMGGAARIAPELLIGKLFPLLGADAVVFPTYGGRFGYSQDTCRQLAGNARSATSLPTPAGGMTLGRVAEKLDFYGPDTMLLIGGNLLLAREHLTKETTTFVRAVADHVYG